MYPEPNVKDTCHVNWLKRANVEPLLVMLHFNGGCHLEEEANAMANTEDFRYKTTEDAIVKAFMQLAEEKGLTNVSVSELCRHAGISRNAFYLHYSGISELCCGLVSQLAAAIEADCLASTDRVLSTNGPDGELPNDLFASFEAHEELIRILLGTDDGQVAQRFAQGLSETYAKTAAAFGKPHETREHRLICSFAAWAHVGFLKQWMAETDRPFAEARQCFADLQEQVMIPHFQLLTESMR